MNSTSLEPFGDRAFLARFADETAAGAWAATVRDWRWPGVIDVVLAYQSVAVFADPDHIDLAELEARLRAVIPSGDLHDHGKRVAIPVLYNGIDLPHVASRLNLNQNDVIALHSGVEYQVFAIGFLPGFPYAGYLPPALRGLARRDSPRVRVPSGSVAIAGRQTGIYPGESPGGWHLLGTTPLRIAVPEEGYFPIQSGDRIRFEPISVDEFEARHHELLAR
jgi:KipI family sensor histidine kinase inhibitor